MAHHFLPFLRSPDRDLRNSAHYALTRAQGSGAAAVLCLVVLFGAAGLIDMVAPGDAAVGSSAADVAGALVAHLAAVADALRMGGLMLFAGRSLRCLVWLKEAEICDLRAGGAL